MRNVTKEIFLNTMVCPTLGWLIRIRGRQAVLGEPSLDQQFRMEQGGEVHERARRLYPDGILISDSNFRSAVDRTESLMNNPDIAVIMEGAFFAGGCATRADILKRDGETWHMIEVKAKIRDEADLVDDMAYTATIIKRCGYKISRISLLLLSKDFRLGMPNEKLFVEVEHTEEVLERIEVFEEQLESVVELTSRENKPTPQLKIECKNCVIFEDCLGEGIENHIFELPGLSKTKFVLLNDLDINRIENIPDDFKLTSNQAKAKNSIVTKKPFISEKLNGALTEIQWPTYYLDFETMSTAIPLYDNTAPYATVPIQYSILKCSAPGNIEDHFEYIADPKRDCRRQLAENLIKYLGQKGSIIVYTNFEKNIINGLADRFSELSVELKSLVNRLVDLWAIISKNVYHYNFRGSTSLKRVLPVLVPKMSYEKLNIKEGGTASVTFTYMAFGKYGAEDIDTLKKDLLEYCKQDTLAMVKLHEQLVRLTSAGGNF